VVRSDNRSEFTSGPIQEFYLEHEILRESSLGGMCTHGSLSHQQDPFKINNRENPL